MHEVKYSRNSVHITVLTDVEYLMSGVFIFRLHNVALYKRIILRIVKQFFPFKYKCYRFCFRLAVLTIYHRLEHQLIISRSFRTAAFVECTLHVFKTHPGVLYIRIGIFRTGYGKPLSKCHIYKI